MRLALFSLLLGLAASAAAVPHLSGPANAMVGSLAQLQVPEGYDWVEAANVPAFMESIQAESKSGDLGVLAHIAAPQYYAVFYYEAIGFWVDPVMTEQDKRNLLEGYKVGTADQSGERALVGRSSIDVGDWIHPPSYDVATHRRAWAVETLETETSGAVTHVANLGFQAFGKDGAMRIIAACKPEDADAVMADLGRVLAGFSFNEGQRYEDAPPPDTSAEDARRAAGEKEKRLYMIVVPLVIASPFILATLYVLLTGKHKTRLEVDAKGDEGAPAAEAPHRRSQAAPSMDDPTPPTTPET